MKTYQKILAYATIAGALSGCENEPAPSKLEVLASPAPTVAHAEASQKPGMDLSAPKATLQTFYNLAQNNNYSSLPDVFLKNLEAMYGDASNTVKRTLKAKRKEDAEFLRKISNSEDARLRVLRCLEVLISEGQIKVRTSPSGAYEQADVQLGQYAARLAKIKGSSDWQILYVWVEKKQ